MVSLNGFRSGSIPDIGSNLNQVPLIGAKKMKTIQFSYFKRFSEWSIGGTLSAIERKTAKQLIARFKGKMKKEFRLSAETRVIILSNRNEILISIQ